MMTDELRGFITLLIMGMMYLIPSAIAMYRKHPAIVPIMLLNILLGWLFFPWVVALCWAFMPIADNKAELQ